MTKVILVLNAGSSSVKFSVFSVREGDLVLLFRGELEEIGTAPHFFASEGGVCAADARFSGVSNDMRDLLASDRPDARLAVDHFVHRIGRELGALAAVLKGLDALVFTAGICGSTAAAVARRPERTRSR